MSKTYETVGNLKVGSYIIIDGEPCRITEISKAKTGKHGSAKATITAISLISKTKKILVAPVDAQVEVPVIEKRTGQIVSDLGDRLQIMDTETFEIFEVAKDNIDESIRDKLAPGMEVEYWEILGTRIVVRPK